jgi:hypothetical protein
MTEWVLRNIDPTAFNVVSDLMAQAIAGLLLLALSFVYPYFVWRAVSRGEGVALDNIMAPPASLLEAISRCTRGGSRRLLSVGIFFLVIATFAHPAADAFLEFKNVWVSSVDTYFLGLQTVDAPASYWLIGDKAIITYNEQDFPFKKLLSEADDIVQGLSRFSILKSSPHFEEFPVSSSGLTAYVSNLTEAQSLEGKMGVQCRSPNYFPEEYVLIRGSSINPDDVAELKEEMLVPDCDYEEDVSKDQVKIDTMYDGVQNWRVIDRMSLVSRQEAFDIGFLIGDEYDEFLDLTADETMLPIILRKDWKFGRKIRDNLTIILGEDAGGVGVQVKHSVLSSLATDPYQSKAPVGNDSYYYTSMFYRTSSWSQNCPVLSDQRTLSVKDYTHSLKEVGGPSGCLIDMSIGCHIFPEDDFLNMTDINLPEVYLRRCYADSMHVTLLEGISVDPIMLAVYSGLYLRSSYPDAAAFIQNLPVNAVAAAYIMTREVVDGALKEYGVRPTINVGYLVLMILPFVLTLPLLALCLSQAKPNVPNNVWKVMAFGRRELDLPAEGDCPPESTLMFGIIRNQDTMSRENDRLGLRTLDSSRPPSDVQTVPTTIEKARNPQKITQLPHQTQQQDQPHPQNAEYYHLSAESTEQTYAEHDVVPGPYDPRPIEQFQEYGLDPSRELTA